jgi:hypothetical protein
MDSTRFADWLRGLHELFINVRVKGGSTLFPVHAQLTGSEVEFINGIPEGEGFMLGDGAFDAKPVLNTIASKGYIPIVRRGIASPGGYGARIRDRAYDETLYAYRSVGERIFGALTVEFRGQNKDEEKRVNKNKNNPKNHNILPKNHGEMDLRISWTRPRKPKNLKSLKEFIK